MAYQAAHHGPGYGPHPHRYNQAYEQDVYENENYDRVPGEHSIFPKIVAGVAILAGVAFGAIYGGQFVNPPRLGATPIVVNTEPGWQSFEMTPEYSNAYAIYIKNHYVGTNQPAAGGAAMSEQSATPSAVSSDETSDLSAPNVTPSTPVTPTPDIGADTSGVSGVRRGDVPELAPEKLPSSPTDLNLDLDRGTPNSSVSPSSRERPSPETGQTPEHRNPSDMGPADNPY